MSKVSKKEKTRCNISSHTKRIRAFEKVIMECFGQPEQLGMNETRELKVNEKSIS